MKICAISDLHGFLPEIEPCDLVLIAGDIFPLRIQTNMPLCKAWIEEEFLTWANALPCNQVLVIAGNHDFWFERETKKAKALMPHHHKVAYLKNELFEYEGIKIFGTPYCKIFGNWAFMREPETLAQKFSEIPENVDILLSHDAPYGVNDIVLEDTPWTNGEHIGNPQLGCALIDKTPKYNIHGHLHSTKHDWEEYHGVLVRNVSIKNERYNAVFDPFYFDIN